MKLKNNALQELYDELVDCAISISPYVESPVEKAFKECDEKLSGSATFAHIKKLENDIDILKRDNEDLLFAKSEVVSYKHKLEKDIKGLHKQIQALKEFNSDLTSKNVDIATRNLELTRKNELLEAKVLETTETLDKVNSDRNSYYGLYTELRKDYDKLFEDNRKLKARTDCLRYEVEWYRKHYKEKSDKIGELKKELGELTSQYKKLTIENKRLQNNVRTGYDQGQTDLWVKLQNVRDTQPNEFDPECECLGDVIDMDLEDFLDAYKKWWEEKEKDRLDHMRDYLARFCKGRLCKGCPLESNKFKCGCGYSFRRRDQFDTRIIPDEELERYYEKARGCGRYTLNMEGINRGISKARESFCKAVRNADTKTTENLRKGCTFEAEVKVNKDLFENLCGIKSEEEKTNPKGLVITTRGVTTANYTEATMNAIKEAVRKLEKSLPALDPWESTITGSIKVDDILGKTNDTEHKLEYGDAVRLPWRDYDYMYIGPDNEEETLVRMFDPKNHAMVTSHIGNVKYNGGKIIICDEDDLRKIWKDMK